MSYQITSVNLHLSDRTVELIKEKLRKIEKVLVDVREDLKDLRVVVNKGPRFGFVAKVELWIPNASFVAKSGNFILEGAIDDAISEMVRQVNKHKGKAYSKDRKLLRKLKHWMFLHGSEE